MPIIKNKRITTKLELHLSQLLKEANKEFSNNWEQSQDSNNKEPINFQNCTRNYQQIIGLVDYNRNKNNTSDALEFYALEAEFGRIQSILNDLPQNPSNEAIILDNDKKIEALKESLACLKTKDKKLNLHAKKGIHPALKKDCQELHTKIVVDSLSKAFSERTAVYNFNYAENIIEEAEKSDLVLKIKCLKRAIKYLSKSAKSYRKAKNSEHANETLQRKNIINQQLKQLEASFQPTILVEDITLTSKKPLVLAHSSKTSYDLHPVEEERQTEFHNNVSQAHSPSALPPKKRKNWRESPDEEGPTLKKSKISHRLVNGIKNFIDKEELTLKKSFILPSIINIKSAVILLKTEEEKKEEKMQQREEEFKKILNQAPVDDSFRFYGQLFFDLSQQLKVCSKESSNHTLLTQLAWLDTAKKLVCLIPNKNQIDNATFGEISSHIDSISSSHKKNLAIISSQKRGEAYPTYDSQDLQAKKLQTLLIKEIIDYYHGLEAFKLTSAATQFLNLISQVINKYSFTNSFKEIEDTIQSAYKLNEALFYAKLLRELIKFYICEENASWRNKTFSSENKINLNKEYLRILSISEGFAEGSSEEKKELRQKIQQLKKHLLQQFPEQDLSLSYTVNYSHSFFKQNKQIEPFSIKLLIKTLQEHFQCLLKYKVPEMHSETLCKDLLRFIQTHCKEQAEIFSKTSLNGACLK